MDQGFPACAQLKSALVHAFDFFAIKLLAFSSKDRFRTIDESGTRLSKLSGSVCAASPDAFDITSSLRAGFCWIKSDCEFPSRIGVFLSVSFLLTSSFKFEGELFHDMVRNMLFTFGDLRFIGAFQLILLPKNVSDSFSSCDARIGSLKSSTTSASFGFWFAASSCVTVIWYFDVPLPIGADTSSSFGEWNGASSSSS